MDNLKQRIEEIILKEPTLGMAAIAISDFIQENFVPKQKSDYTEIILPEKYPDGC